MNKKNRIIRWMENKENINFTQFPGLIKVKKRGKKKSDKDGIIGDVRYHKEFFSRSLFNKRDIIVWLPPNYEKNTDTRYPVLYMHDGQNIMDPSTSYTGADWRVDETVSSLIKENKIQEIIVVGIYNTENRLEEYSDSEKGKNYAKFIIEELKTFIDQNYRTSTHKNDTAVMGSSMGGLISFLIVWNYPHFIAKAACLSSSFYFNSDRAIEMVRHYNGPKKDVKIYIDHGEDGLIRGQQMFSALTEKGYIIGREIDYFYSPGAEHNENAWAVRIERPLRFLFGKK